MRGVVVSPHGGLLEGADHAFEPTVGPGMSHLGKPVLSAVFPAAHVEHVRHVLRRRPVGVSRREGELEYHYPSEPCGSCRDRPLSGFLERFPFEWNHLNDKKSGKTNRLSIQSDLTIAKILQESRGGLPVGLFLEPDEDEFRGPLDRCEHVRLSVVGAHFCDIDMELRPSARHRSEGKAETDGTGLEGFLRFSLALQVRQPGDIVALAGAMQAGAGQVRECVLHGI